MIDILAKDVVYFSRLPDRGVDCSVLRLAHERWGPLTHARRADFDVQSLAVAVAGEGRFASGSRRWDLRSGTVFSFGPGAPHEFWCEPPHELEIYILDFTGRRASAMVAESTGGTTLAVSPSNPHVIIADVEHMFEVARTTQPFAHETCTLLLRALLLNIRAGLATAPHSAPPAEASYFACKSYIDHHFTEMTSTAEAAAGSHVSHAYMCRLFRRHGNVPPQVYLARLKMNLAAHLLLTSGRSVKEISRELRFSDQYAFSRCFKRLMGVSPQQYRDRLVAPRPIERARLAGVS